MTITTSILGFGFTCSVTPPSIAKNLSRFAALSAVGLDITGIDRHVLCYAIVRLCRHRVLLYCFSVQPASIFHAVRVGRPFMDIGHETFPVSIRRSSQGNAIFASSATTLIEYAGRKSSLADRLPSLRLAECTSSFLDFQPIGSSATTGADILCRYLARSGTNGRINSQCLFGNPSIVRFRRVIDTEKKPGTCLCQFLCYCRTGSQFPEYTQAMSARARTALRLQQTHGTESPNGFLPKVVLNSVSA